MKIETVNDDVETDRMSMWSWMRKNDQACRDCLHWEMDWGMCLDTEHFQADFGYCMYPMPNLPFWGHDLFLPDSIRGHMTDAGAGAHCKVFSIRGVR